MCAASSSVSFNNLGFALFGEVRNAMHSKTSTELPTFFPKTEFISVMRHLVGTPAPLATSTMLLPTSCAISRVLQNAPFPVFTSMTNASSPAASFFDKIEAVINPTDSMVAVTSRIEYRR